VAELAKYRAQLADKDVDVMLKDAMVGFLRSGGRMYGDAVGDLRETLLSDLTKDPAATEKIKELEAEIKTLEDTKIKELKNEIEGLEKKIDKLEEKIKELEKKQGEERRLGL